MSVDAIAAAAKTTKVTIYQHFASKEAIFVACLTARLAARDATLAERFDERVIDRSANSPTDPAMLLEFFDWMQGSATSNRYLGCAFVKATNELSETLPEVRQISRRAKDGLRKKIVEAAAASNLNGPKELADQLVVLLEGAQTLSLVEHSTRPFQPARAAASVLLQAHGWHATAANPGPHRRKSR